MSRLELVPFADEHLGAAASLLAARHARHRAAEPLLPDVSDFVVEIEREWRAEGAAGVTIRRGRPDDIDDAARLERAMSRSMLPSPSFSGVTAPSADEVGA